LETVVGSIGVRLTAGAAVFLAFAFSGCAVSEKRQSSDYTADPSANRWKVIAGTEKAPPAADKPGGISADEDFDLLEEELVEQKVEIADPLEPFNRTMYGLNDILYFWVVKPVTGVYTGLTPKPARIGIRNFFQNLTTPIRLVNCLLQGKGDGAHTELDRFVVNTTVGVLGFGDPARDKYGLEPVEEDLGQTLAVYGLGDGFYIVWPLLGPSTVRDSVGRFGDGFLNPLFYLEPTEAAVGASVLRFTNESSFHIGEYESFKADAVEPYIAMRRAYIQYRNKQIKK
jgi:phospholipid-binding lipoprotein MlaA